MEILHTWLDASFAVHNDMKGHTGGTMSFGKGVLHAKSSKQKLNTKSSTETELVGVSEYIPYTIWMKKFLHEQGYKVTGNVYQDNQSSIRMEKNGRNFCTGNSRHVNIRFFFVKDLVDKKEIEIVYCPTETMLADYFTKPSQTKILVYKEARETFFLRHIRNAKAEPKRKKGRNFNSYWQCFLFPLRAAPWTPGSSDLH